MDVFWDELPIASNDAGVLVITVSSFVVPASDATPAFPKLSVVDGILKTDVEAGVIDVLGVLPNENGAGVVATEDSPTKDAEAVDDGATTVACPPYDGAVTWPNVTPVEGAAKRDRWLSNPLDSDLSSALGPGTIDPNGSTGATDEMFPSDFVVVVVVPNDILVASSFVSSSSASSSSSYARESAGLKGVADLPLSPPPPPPLFDFFNPGVAITELAQLNELGSGDLGELGSGDLGGVIIFGNGVDDGIDDASIGVLDGVLVTPSSPTLPELNFPRLATLPPVS